MESKQINPEKITKPIQLLGAWLAGLIIVNGSFLGAASSISSPQWVAGALVVASIVNVPLFLGCIFLLQTKFRPEMQEDSYYSKYLESSTGKLVIENRNSDSNIEIKELIESTNKLNISMLSGLEDGLSNIAVQVKSLSEATEQSDKFQENIEKIEKSIANSSKAISSARRSINRPNPKAGININDLLPNYEELLDALSERGLSISSTFGSTSAEPEVPKIKVLGFGENVAIDMLRDVTQIVRDSGFSHIHFANKDFNRGRIYVGSYIYRADDVGEQREVLLTDEIYDLIMNPASSLEDVIKKIIETRA